MASMQPPMYLKRGLPNLGNSCYTPTIELCYTFYLCSRTQLLSVPFLQERAERAAMFPLDRRQLAAHVYCLLHSLRKTALILQVSHTTVARWLKCSTRKPYSLRAATKSQKIAEALRAMVLAEPFTSLSKLQLRVQETFGFTVSKELLRTVIRQQGLSKKTAKFFSKPAHLEQTTADFIKARDAFVAENRLFVSLDETSFGRNWCDSRGYAPIGRQLIVCRARPRMTTMSCLVAMTQSDILQRHVVSGSFCTDRFVEFLRSLELPPKAVILLDNVRFHHAKAVKYLAQQRQWALLYTPPYSPWFNPIEGVFSIVKRQFYTGKSIDESFAAVTRGHLAAFMNKSLSIRDMPQKN